MTRESPERWRQVERVLDEALDLPEAERAAFLDRVCVGDSPLRSEVERLLHASSLDTGFLEGKASEFAAPILERSATEPRPLSRGTRVGPYRVVSEAGHGGMGAVYLAERADGQYQKRVALKVVHGGEHLDPAIVARFVDERQILATLEHPNIARMLDGGVSEDGSPYFAMEYVEGMPITAYCDRQKLALDARLQLFTTVCMAVQHAHQHRIVHRDLKPSNILVTPQGQVKLLDFGIAKMLEPAEGVGNARSSRPSMRLMTPEYASPEQIAGWEISAASDVYSLGVLLFELLTGRRPTDPESADARELPADLDAIVHKAMQREPTRRYETAEQLGMDLGRYLEGKPVTARRNTWSYRTGKFLARHRLAAIAAGGVGLLAASVAVQRHRAPDEAVVVAVGSFTSMTPGDSSDFAPSLSGILAADLARIPGLAVVSQARLYDLMVQLGAGEETSSARAEAAGLAGATLLIEGIVRHGSGDSLRLDLREVNLPSGKVRASYTVRGTDVRSLASSVTIRLAAGLRRQAPADLASDAATTSLVALRFYEEGLRAYYLGDPVGATRLFVAALSEDSTFAMAAYYASLCAQAADEYFEMRDYLARAVRSARGAPERERLTIDQAWAEFNNSPDWLPLAKSLATKYPTEPGGEYALGRALVMSGDFLDAIPHFHRAIEMDSVSLKSRSPRCGACDGLWQLLNTYLLADSIPGAERVVREWHDRQPGSAIPLLHLGRVLSREDRFTEANAALSAAAPLFPANPDLALDRVQLAIRAGDFAQADRILMDRSALGNTTTQMNAAWWEVLSLRYQGRLSGAMTWARRYRRLFESVNGLKEPQHGGAIPQAQVLFESGRYREAAALFDSIASTPSDFQTAWPGVAARHVSWNLTHAGTALSAAGDTLILALLADSIERTARGSMYGRDGRLHNHLRGLLWEARGRSDSAAAAFERAIFSRTEGYTRTNLELAGALIRLHRPREAVEILRSALRGGLEASNYYVTQTELRALLAEAFEAAGEPDSAATHYAWVEHAWRSGDPGYRARAVKARERIAVLRAK